MQFNANSNATKIYLNYFLEKRKKNYIWLQSVFLQIFSEAAKITKILKNNIFNNLSYENYIILNRHMNSNNLKNVILHYISYILSVMEITLY